MILLHLSGPAWYHSFPAAILHAQAVQQLQADHIVKALGVPWRFVFCNSCLWRCPIHRGLAHSWMAEKMENLTKIGTPMLGNLHMYIQMWIYLKRGCTQKLQRFRDDEDKPSVFSVPFLCRNRGLYRYVKVLPWTVYF